MSCSVCHTSYSFFTREVACPGCGFSCCSKCLKYKSDLPKEGTKKVCGRCYNKYKPKTSTVQKSVIDTVIGMQDGNELDEPMAPVDIKKKLDSLENPGKPPITLYAHTTHWDKFKTGLEPADQEIAERLRKLKEGNCNIPLPNDDELRRRLAVLKDEDPDANGSSRVTNIYQVDSRTDQQKTDDLIQEYLEHLELSSSIDPMAKLEARLRALQDRGAKSEQPVDMEDMCDEENVTKRLISKAIAEASLEAKYDADVDEVVDMNVENRTASDEEEEKPSCVMCEQTENLERCLGCNGDLFCAVCFDDNHDEFELGKHKREPASGVH